MSTSHQDSWQAWVEGAFKGGSSKAHKYSNRDNGTTAVALAPTPEGCLDVSAHLLHQHQTWEHTWLANDITKVKLAQRSIHKFRDFALRHSLATDELLRCLSPPNIRLAARSFSKKTTVGSDHVAFDWIASQPLESLEELSSIFKATVYCVALPDSFEEVWLFLLGKN